LLQKDLPLLQREHERNPGDTRTVFYLAQTLELVGDSEAALAMYRKRIDMGGWQQEVFESHLRRVRGVSLPAAARATLACTLLLQHVAQPDLFLTLTCSVRLCLALHWSPLFHYFPVAVFCLPGPSLAEDIQNPAPLLHVTAHAAQGRIKHRHLQAHPHLNPTNETALDPAPDLLAALGVCPQRAEPLMFLSWHAEWLRDHWCPRCAHLPCSPAALALLCPLCAPSITWLGCRID
jgi:hypothetical protein